MTMVMGIGLSAYAATVPDTCECSENSGCNHFYATGETCYKGEVECNVGKFWYSQDDGSFKPAEDDTDNYLSVEHFGSLQQGWYYAGGGGYYCLPGSFYIPRSYTYPYSCWSFITCPHPQLPVADHNSTYQGCRRTRRWSLFMWSNKEYAAFISIRICTKWLCSTHD